MTRETAELLAIRALGYLAGDTEQLARFLALSGVAPEDLRTAATEASFLSGVLDFFLGDEAVLLAFTASTQVDPADVAIAREVLSRHAAD
jgi:predicted HAD superfamily phosphohydrolase